MSKVIKIRNLFISVWLIIISVALFYIVLVIKDNKESSYITNVSNIVKLCETNIKCDSVIVIKENQCYCYSDVNKIINY